MPFPPKIHAAAAREPAAPDRRPAGAAAASAGGQPWADVRCRRCGGAYRAPVPPSRHVNCPHCSTALRPWRPDWRNNRNAATLAAFAVVALTGGMLLPFISMTQLGQTRTFGLPGGIFELFRQGNWALAAVLFGFSVVLPYVKLGFILVATSRLARLSALARERLHRWAVFTGRYSMLDLLVAAVMIVVVKFDGVADVSARPGTLLFLASVVLSVLAGLCVRLPSSPSLRDGPGAPGAGGSRTASATTLAREERDGTVGRP